MDKIIRTSLNMQTAVSHLIDDYEDVVAADPDLVASEAIRQLHLGRVRVASRKAAIETPANTQRKEAEKKRVINEMMKPIDRAAAWAARTGNAAIGITFTTTPSKLNEIADGEIIGTLEGYMTALRGIVGQVPTIPSATLDALDDEIDALQPLIGSTRNLIVDRGAAKEEEANETRAARLVLETQHDKIVRSFDHAAPVTPLELRQKEFFNRWSKARELVDAPTTSEPETPANLV